MSDSCNGTSVWDTISVIRLLLNCGRRGMQTAPGGTHWQVKQDGSLLTEADTAIEAYLRRELDRPECGSYVIGEETVASQPPRYLEAAWRNTTWIVDPIDGTAPYAHGLDGWGTSIGYMNRGRLEEGAVFLPAAAELLISERGAVYRATAVDPEAVPEAVHRERLSIRPAPFTPGSMVAVGQDIVKKTRLHTGNPVVALGSAVAVVAHLLAGRVDAYIGSMKLWDLAGGLPLLWNAGFETALFNGRVLTDVIDDSTFVLPPAVYERWALRDRCVFAPPGTARDLISCVEVEP